MSKNDRNRLMPIRSTAAAEAIASGHRIKVARPILADGSPDRTRRMGAVVVETGEHVDVASTLISAKFGLLSVVAREELPGMQVLTFAAVVAA